MGIKGRLMLDIGIKGRKGIFVSYPFIKNYQILNLKSTEDKLN